MVSDTPQSSPTVAILMATYNGEKYVKSQIRSLQDQTYTNWRLFVSDDGSTDATKDIVQAICNEDDRIELVLQNERYGSAKDNFMALLLFVGDSYDYVMFCDQDDVWSKTKVELELQNARSIEEQMGSEHPVLICTDLHVVDEDLSLIDESFMTYSNFGHASPTFNRLLIENMVVGCTVLINRPMCALAHRTPDDAHIVMHDRWLALMASGLGTIRYVDIPTIEYRQHTANSMGAQRFSLANALHSGIWREQCIQIRESILQATSFQTAFGSLLPAAKAQSLYHFCRLTRHPRICRIRDLRLSHAWKTGLARKSAQVVALLFSRWI